MYYHVCLNKIFHNGRVDMGEQVGWDFHSLTEALVMIERDFGTDAVCWRIQDLTEKTPNIMQLEADLRVALESTHQYVVMTFKDGVSTLAQYDHYEFCMTVRDEAEHPMSSTLMEEVKSIKMDSKSREDFMDLQKGPVTASQYRSHVNIFDNTDGSFHGVVVVLKDGNHIVVFAGENEDKVHVNLRTQGGIAKGLVRRVLPSVSPENGIRGFRIQMVTGERIYLTVAKLIVTQAQVDTEMGTSITVMADKKRI